MEVLGVIAAFTRADAAVIAVGLLLYTCMDTSAVLSSVYVPEIFPTEARLTGTGFAFACGRTSFILLPLFIALLLRTQGPAALYFLVAALGLALEILVAFGAFETRGRSLEEPMRSTRAQG
jgi:putative MFS transporter